MFVSPMHTYLVSFVLNLHSHHLVDDSRNLESSLQTVSLETTTLDRDLEGGVMSVYSNSHLLPRRLSPSSTSVMCVLWLLENPPCRRESVCQCLVCEGSPTLCLTGKDAVGTCGTHNSNSYLASFSLHLHTYLEALSL